MLLLDKSRYEKVIEPLNAVTSNNLFARSVVENHIDGCVYVDHSDHPKTFYVIHPYGMSLLFGQTNNETFNAMILDHALNVHKTRTKYEWMQAAPGVWDATLLSLFSGFLIKSHENLRNKNQIELNTRVNFKFNVNLFKEHRKSHERSDVKVIRTDKNAFENMKGSVVPKYFWKNADHFLKEGMGLSLLYKNQLASIAFSAFIHDDQLELGIETVEEFRGYGFAKCVCSALIDYCLENNFEPVWSCRLENIGSYKLALQLGFEPTLRLPYYRLCH